MSDSKVTKDAYVPNPVPEAVLTLAFALLCLSLPYVYPEHPQWFLSTFAVAFVAVEGVVLVSRIAFRALGASLVGLAMRAKLLDEDPLESRLVREKFMNQSWQLVIHVGGGLLEYYLLFVRTPDEKLPAIWTKPHLAFRDLETQEQAPELWALYIGNLAVWIYMGILHVAFEKRRKDYLAMLTHHVATIILIAGSIRTNGMRAGLMVLFANDWSDVFVDTLKMANYLKLRGQKAMFISETAFVLMMVMFAVFRLYILPFKVNYDCGVTMYNEMRTEHDVGEWYHYPWTLHRYPPWASLNSMLWVLTALNIWWFWLMVRIIIRIVTDGAQQASRDEYEGGSEDEGDAEPESGYVILGSFRAIWRLACGPSRTASTPTPTPKAPASSPAPAQTPADDTSADADADTSASSAMRRRKSRRRMDN